MQEERVAYVSDEDAERIWKRAAELQLEASRRVEQRSRRLDAATDSARLSHAEHLRLNDVVEVARQVGIDEEYVERAVQELHERSSRHEMESPDFLERLAAKFFGSPPANLEASADIPADVETVYGILQRLLPGEPYRLRLREVIGQDPLSDGVLVFDAPEQLVDRSSYAHAVLMAQGRIQRIFVTLRRGREEHPSTRVTLRGWVEADPEPAFWVGSALTTGASGVGGYVGAVLAAGLGVPAVLLAAPAVAAAAGSGGVAYWLYRHRYLHPIVRSVAAYREILGVLKASVQTAGAFLPAQGTDRLQEKKERPQRN